MKSQNQEQQNFPNVINELVEAQNNFDSHAYAECFTDDAIVFDEGKTHNGKIEIENWISKANSEYKAVMKPLEFDASKNILSSEITGSFPGSPITLKYHFSFHDELIQSLKITD